VDEATIRAMGIDPRARAETLAPGDFVKLANAM
jgi:16S rRNA (adenine1518-N6/adenine1519-N6)-dimethyltransferase